MKGRIAALAAVLVAVAACTAVDGKRLRPNESIVDDGVAPQCAGDFDTAPVLVRAKAPVYPVSMLNPTLIDDRKTRHLPMSWPVESSFEVGVDGVPSNVRSTATEPASFGQHVTIAIRAWRFAPAMRGAAPVAASCRFDIVYELG